tara:strand:+ start:392 stop:565 length:174 start_codon:yes stop_codon:yes gene_type:complete
MNSAAQTLRDAADCVATSAIGEIKSDEIKLIAYHIKRLCGAADVGEETRLLIRILER